jgi:hypothetical protein
MTTKETWFFRGDEGKHLLKLSSIRSLCGLTLVPKHIEYMPVVLGAEVNTLTAEFCC